MVAVLKLTRHEARLLQDSMSVVSGNGGLLSSDVYKTLLCNGFMSNSIKIKKIFPSVPQQINKILCIGDQISMISISGTVLIERTKMLS